MALVEVRQVSKQFQQGETVIPVLRDLSFGVEAGDTVAIVGQSGSGKSTLLSMLAGLDQPTQGTITVDGQDLGRLTQNELTRFRGRSIGIIFQQFHLMRSLTALENVLLPLDILGLPNAEERAMDALTLMGLGARAKHLPQQLSGGECQRVAIARAFVVEPRILLADEPSGNLDTATGDKVMNLLFDAVAQRGMTLILVTHDMQLASRCKKRLPLVQGQLQTP
ncbi:MAG TPA: ABC transporter ATP-binding protein [Oligoflexus sp.]|uniref:ABC transporter ATP-binding protein n=1 Tax=Oligoflexus sp. TaxID=1971216 RepID=UPI002D80E550|nr:ABC transporter ATP-binding protein [Oligoflexus sp.]HET9239744.1 ABC transporter ATP-binding protein [Oligoflexus sp.]